MKARGRSIGSFKSVKQFDARIGAAKLKAIKKAPKGLLF
jgi:hypothetical protein